jgi:hypothetical protein
VEGDEPGASYVAALRRWPEDVARIPRTALAKQINCSASYLSTLLSNSRSWNANPNLLKWARKIIQACGGTPEDVNKWTAYHHEVSNYQLTDGGTPMPEPPEPSQFAEPNPTWSAISSAEQANARAGTDTTLFAIPQPLLAEQPSALLRAEHGVVPFIGRAAELAGLHEWAAEKKSLSVQMVTGPAGQGKTRLGYRLCAQLHGERWLAGLVGEHVPDEVLRRSARASTPILLVIDYAETRVQQLIILAAALLGRQRPSTPVRLLLLARTGGEWLRLDRSRFGGHGVRVARSFGRHRNGFDTPGIYR